MRFLLLPFIFAIPAFSQSLEDCSIAASYQGEPSGAAQIAESCKSIVFERGFHSTAAFGASNMLYIENSQKDGSLFLIAGPQTKLSEIQQVESVRNEDRVYILNKQENKSSILSFKMDAGGNIAPVRKLIAEDVEAASGFATDFQAKKVYVFSREENWVRSFNLHADPDGRTPANSTKKIGEIKLLTPPSNMIVAGDDLIVQASAEILVMDKNLVASDPKQVLALPEFEEVLAIEFDQIKNALVVKNQEGANIVFLKDSSGFFTRAD